MAIKLSAVIPLYNKAACIRRTLMSVISQEEKIDEIIIVDDGSTDDWQSEVDDLIAEHDVRVITQPNSGVSVARNVGARSASNLYVCLLDADDEWLPNYSKEIRILIEQCPEASVHMVRNFYHVDGNDIPRKVTLPAGFSGVVPNFLDAYRESVGLIHSSSVCIKRDVFDRYEGFPPGVRKSEDIYFWLVLGLQEVFAYRNVPCTRIHKDHSGYGLRSTIVPYYLEYFLEPDNFARYANNKALLRFLRKYAFVALLGEKLHGNIEVANKIVRKTAVLGWPLHAAAKVIAWLPTDVFVYSRKLKVYFRQRA